MFELAISEKLNVEFVLCGHEPWPSLMKKCVGSVNRKSNTGQDKY